MAVWAVALARIDFAQHRLPDRLTLPAIPAAIAIVADLWPERLVKSITWAVIVVGFAVILALIADLGWGDVKLLVSLGLFVGGAAVVDQSVLAICVAGGVHVLVHLVVNGDRKAHIPFGPAILMGFAPVVAAMV